MVLLTKNHPSHLSFTDFPSLSPSPSLSFRFFRTAIEDIEQAILLASNSPTPAVMPHPWHNLYFPLLASAMTFHCHASL
jgi:hypothetical protein